MTEGSLWDRQLMSIITPAHKVSALAKHLAALLPRPVKVMEVCGTHTVNIFRFGLRSLFPETLELVSGPGCPVCVTPVEEIDFLVAAALSQGVRLATFGDLLRVPGSWGSLKEARAQGAKIKIIYSPMEALSLAEKFPQETVLLAAVGFETTAPAVAATVLEAKRRGVSNLVLATSHRLVPPAIRALLASGDLNLDGFILPGHVSAIIGREPYEFIARDFGLPGVITGFEATDIMEGLCLLAHQIREGRAEIVIQYSRAVPPEGNPAAQALMKEVFSTGDASFRGLGEIPGGGLFLRQTYEEFDARGRLDLDLPPVRETKGCLCGQILSGRKRPLDCPLFARGCRPDNPQGPCMVSTEGTCAAWFQFYENSS